MAPMLRNGLLGGLQSLIAGALCVALAGDQLGLGLVLPTLLVTLWLPLLWPAPRQSAVAAAGGDDLQALSRDLSQTTTLNALSAAEVAYAVRHLGERLASQLGAAERIVDSAQQMIATEEQTSLLSEQALGAARQQRRRPAVAARDHRLHAPAQRPGRCQSRADRNPQPA
jgi:methyl-accepting chemotaxis protein